jgi:hypothetical protein
LALSGKPKYLVVIDTDTGEGIIDAQFAASAIYTGITMGVNKTMFGVSFADGRIKGYPADSLPGQPSDNGNGIITNNATGLMWIQAYNGGPISWQDALVYAKNADFAGHSDRRLTDVRELQSLTINI